MNEVVYLTRKRYTAVCHMTTSCRSGGAPHVGRLSRSQGGGLTVPSAGEIATVNTNAGIAQRQYEHARAELARLMSQTSGTEQPEIPLAMFERAIRNLVKEEG